MLHLKDSNDIEDRKDWQAFSDGDFSCQKSEIPGTAIFSSDGSILDSSKSRSEAVNELLKYTVYDPKDKSPLNPDFVVIDAMKVLNAMTPIRRRNSSTKSLPVLKRFVAITFKTFMASITTKSGFSGDLSFGSYTVYLSNSLTASDLDLLPSRSEPSDE
jgi:hypothetical protein